MSQSKSKKNYQLTAGNIRDEEEKVVYEEFLKALKRRSPLLFQAIEQAAAMIHESGAPAPLLFMQRDRCYDETARHLLAHDAVRIAVRRCTGATLVGSDPQHFWLLPEELDVYPWLESNFGHVSAGVITMKYPEAKEFIFRLVDATHSLIPESPCQSSSLRALDSDSLPALNQLIDIFSCQLYRRFLEEEYRLVFAFVEGDTVLARMLTRPDVFVQPTSPQALLEYWRSQS